MTVVAISASYGAGGSRIAPALARRLGVPFLDRAIPASVAAQLQVPLDEAERCDERAEAGLLARLLASFRAADAYVPAALPAEGPLAEDFQQATEEVVRRQAASGQGVILGRAAAFILREEPGVLRVRLDGPRERRVAQAMALEGLDRADAERRLRESDRAHGAYAQRFYGADMRDPSLYQLMIDSTALALERCVELIAIAAGALQQGAAGEGAGVVSP
ncbi:MAG TPA: cytidylate kinase-like family protein [Solirubrobacteraceae bacterium]|nr:cytidylate kinase-like family protein [Solirubrobacteraceae bacterium]